MSMTPETPTPETDALESKMVGSTQNARYYGTLRLARKLERERDAARAENAAMRAVIKNTSHFASCILTEAGRQWQATQPLPDIASIEAVAQQIQDELQRFIKP